MSNGISSLIAGKFEYNLTDSFNSLNPANPEEIIGKFGNATAEECKKACQTAQEGFQIWKKVPAPQRGEIIRNFGDLITKNKEVLSQHLSKEMGKPLREARGDIQEAIDTCVFFASEGRRLYGQTIPSEMPNKELFTFRKPLGVVACITAGNFPFAVPAWYFVPALLCGNACVWKPSEDTPNLSLLFAKLIHAAGVPPKAFNVLFGEGQKTGRSLINLVGSGLIQKVGFTGSTEVGQHIGEVCGENLQSPCLELGGKNPMVVTPSANLDLAVHGALWSAFGTAGQRCTSLGNLILHTSIKDTFLSKLLNELSKIKMGDPMHPDVFCGPLISQKFLTNHQKNLDTLVKSKHALLTKQNGAMTRTNLWPNFIGNFAEGYYAFPTILSNVTQDDEIYKTETFGPLINVLSYTSLSEAISLSNGTGYGLSSSIYSNNSEEIFEFKEEISAGMTSINNSTTGAEAHLPFGGNGKSGNGSRQSGIWVIDQFTKWQAVNWDYSGKLQLAQIDTGSVPNTEYIIPSIS